ncbi:hypothetical protein CPB83DRAFT_907537 [Crepidotus variabilis]|uniref:NAD(P)-binding protein n=1 Tax=Crepidotus variabilis TaxID=179855 RepID=A0A9P6EEZ4_9AGAR|nr:hypothetical protein CPB83DRAFT_907537 [Crepidotus variabilis]
MANPGPWCPPIHHNPEGPLDFSRLSLPSPFVVVILGASKGIGAGCVRAFIKAGASVVVTTGRSIETLQTQKQELEKLNSKITILPIQCDVTKESNLIAVAKATRENFGRLDALIINAGVASKLVRQLDGLLDWPNNFIDADMPDYRALMELNTIAPWIACHHFLPLLEETKDGAQSIILISSAAAHYVNPKHMSAAYSVSKFAATRMVEHVHEAHHANGVCAFAIQPGGVKGGMDGAIPEGKGWEPLLIDSPELVGAFSVWLTSIKKPWLSGRYLDARWDTEELTRRKDEILEKDLLKFRLVM